MKKQPIFTSKPVDKKYEYAPAVSCTRSGLLFVSGMVGWDDQGRVVHKTNIALQARQAFTNLRDVLKEAGATFSDIVMETEYVVDVERYRDIALVRREFFGDSRPAATVVEVNRLFKPDLLFEIQVVAALT